MFRSKQRKHWSQQDRLLETMSRDQFNSDDRVRPAVASSVASIADSGNYDTPTAVTCCGGNCCSQLPVDYCSSGGTRRSGVDIILRSGQNNRRRWFQGKRWRCPTLLRGLSVTSLRCRLPPAVFVPTITLVEVIVYMCQSVVVFQPQQLYQQQPLLMNEDPVGGDSSSSSSHFQRQESIRFYDGYDKSLSRQPTIGSLLAYRPDKRNELWRYVLYIFVHIQWQHLILNVIVQLLAGVPLELLHGASRIAVVYTTGVVAGSVATSVFDSKAVLVGSSSGVYALVAAHLPSLLLNYAEVELGSLKLAVICIVATVEVLQSVWNYQSGIFPSYRQSSTPVVLNGHALPRAPSVSNVAHLMGAVAGLTTGLLLLGRRTKNCQLPKPHHRDKTAVLVDCRIARPSTYA